jgi:glycosyltransferase involved in cell wall biosynthesis
MEACLSVVMPVFNEEATVERAVSVVLESPFVRELIAINDGSTDGTRRTLDACAEKYDRLSVIHFECNQGKGAAVRAGFARALADYVIIQDADHEYSPQDYGALLAPLLSGDADVVLGTRFSGGYAHRVLYYWHSLGNKFLTTLSNITTNLNLTDMECCYKVFKREVLSRFKIEEDRFGIEPEIVAKISRLDLRIYEVAVSYRGRTYKEGKKITWKDGFQALYCIFKYGVLVR